MKESARENRKDQSGSDDPSSSHALPSPTRRRWFEFQTPVSRRARVILGLLAWLLVLAAWQTIPTLNPKLATLFPPPTRVAATLVELFAEKNYLADVLQSLARVAQSFTLAIAIALPLGVLMGSFPRVEAFFNPIVSPFRYLPAPSFIPLLLAWLGTGDNQKIALLVIGVVWFLISLYMDDAKRVPRELIEASSTLGASRPRILLHVIVPCALPALLDTTRQMLAVSWTYLVIAEIVASTDGIGSVMMRARRLVRMDIIMAGILTIGLLGLLSDTALRTLRWAAFPHLRHR